MGVTSISVRDQGKDFSRTTGASHQFQLRKFKEFVIELEDLHFHHDSAVVLPDFDTETPAPDATVQPRVTALAVFAKTLRLKRSSWLATPIPAAMPLTMWGFHASAPKMHLPPSWAIVPPG
jgi:hypothetical protein